MTLTRSILIWLLGGLGIVGVLKAIGSDLQSKVQGASVPSRQVLVDQAENVEIVCGMVGNDVNGWKREGLCVEWPAKSGSESDLFEPELIVGYCIDGKRFGTWRGFNGASWLSNEFRVSCRLSGSAKVICAWVAA